MYRNILIATDGSERAGKAVAQGLALAKDLGAKATAVTVTEMWSAREMGSRVALGEQFPTQDYDNQAAAGAQAILAGVAAQAKASGVACQTLHIPDHAPAAGILKAAADGGCDLIVLASHGRSGLTRLVMGSQAADVMAGAAVPVLVCR